MELNVILLFILATHYCLASRRTTTAYGRVTCYGKPMPHVKIILKDRDMFIDDTFGSTRADSQGRFKVTGRAGDPFRNKPDPYIRVEYQYSGTYGRMEVEGLVFGKNRAGETSTRKYARYINFHGINFNTIHCKAYVQFYAAMRNFRERAGINLPVSRLHIRTGVLIHGGTPYATTNVIRIPKKYKSSQIDSRLAKHELAHTARHNMDGSMGHFIRDAGKFWYLRSHNCATKSNHGYAFNEGWAEYWAGSCKKSGGYGKRPTDYSIEGNVANALRKLKEDCSSNNQKFVQVLKRNRGKIHSFKSFNQHHKKLYNCKI